MGGGTITSLIRILRIERPDIRVVHFSLGDHQRPTAPVTVTVNYKGKPVAGATVQFVTVEDPKNVSPVAPEDADLVGAGPPPILKNLIPAKYALPGSSGLKEEVKSGKNTFTFDLKD